MAMKTDTPYIIGIDLGTTNCALSYTEPKEAKPRIRIFDIPQMTSAGEFSTLPVLPSFLYIPGEYDFSEESLAIPWQLRNKHIVGKFARDYGAKVPSRLVSSAKSWLCHGNVDRQAKILPWGSGSEVFKVSPVAASAAYLEHLRLAWNSTKGDDEELYLENQMIILTVPASFDEVARDLTLEAAKLAGLKQVTLLEEPLAAFYSWLIRHDHHWQEFVNPGELILVCDVGGGTTDFTLITLRETEKGSPRFERIAVGDHLILGGDNMDLALARSMEKRFYDKTMSLSSDRWKSLCFQCRQAKEILLEDKAQSKKITIMGQGGKLIAKTLSAMLSRKEVYETIIDGFFPIVDAETVMTPKRKGITEFGLPYEHEPAITKHLGQFMERHKVDIAKFLNRGKYIPDLILFNGGVLKPKPVRERIRAAIRHWFHELDERIPRELDNPYPDLAVALGASYYGLIRQGRGVKVGSGSARSFYIGVDAGSQKRAICLIERGLEEGSKIELADKSFEVIANQPVNFDIYSSGFRSGDRCGDLVEIDNSLTALPPIRTVVQFGKKGISTRIPVRIEAEYTEVGTLAIWCKSGISDHSWRLQFQLRGKEASAAVPTEDIMEDGVAKAVSLTVKNAFSQNSDPETLVKDISAIVNKSKENWSLSLIRLIADELIVIADRRKIMPNMESLWLNLTGFCLRPGFGEGFDAHRLKKIWKIYMSGPVFANNARVRSEWWIFWRRVAGGLNSGHQRQMIQDLNHILMSKSKSKIPSQELTEIWMLAANLEQLSVKDKIALGRKLLEDITPKKCRAQQFWSLSRIGARELLYGSADKVIPAQEVSAWIEKLLDLDWQDPKLIMAALSQMGRKTGDRIIDIGDDLRKRVIRYISQYDSSNSDYIRLLTEIVAMEKQEQSSIFGESLPSGLVEIQTLSHD